MPSSFFTQKVAVITGAAAGLGRALAIELYSRGCHLALIDIDLPNLETLKAELLNPAQTVTIHQADVSHEADIISAVSEISLHHGHVDILINNAAISISQNFTHINMADFMHLMDVNFWGTVCCTRHILPLLPTNKGASIVNIISQFAHLGFPGKSAYASSKAAIAAFSNTLCTELATSGIHVTQVIPPAMNTDLVLSGPHISPEKQAKELAFLQKHGMPLPVVARKIANGLTHRRQRIVISPMLFWSDLALRLFPSLIHKLLAKTKSRFPFVE